MCAISINLYDWDSSESEGKRPKPTPFPHNSSLEWPQKTKPEIQGLFAVCFKYFYGIKSSYLFITQFSSVLNASLDKCSVKLFIFQKNVLVQPIERTAPFVNEKDKFFGWS